MPFVQLLGKIQREIAYPSGMLRDRRTPVPAYGAGRSLLAMTQERDFYFQESARNTKVRRPPVALEVGLVYYGVAVGGSRVGVGGSKVGVGVSPPGVGVSPVGVASTGVFPPPPPPPLH